MKRDSGSATARRSYLSSRPRSSSLQSYRVTLLVHLVCSAASRLQSSTSLAHAAPCIHQCLSSAADHSPPGVAPSQRRRALHSIVSPPMFLSPVSAHGPSLSRKLSISASLYGIIGCDEHYSRLLVLLHRFRSSFVVVLCRGVVVRFSNGPMSASPRIPAAGNQSHRTAPRSTPPRSDPSPHTPTRVRSEHRTTDTSLTAETGCRHNSREQWG